LKKYPDFFSSGRFEQMYKELPDITEGDFQNSITKSDGSTVGWNPRSYTYFWKKANIRLQTKTSVSKPFRYAMQKLVDVPNKYYIDGVICYERLLINIPLFTADFWDMLSGSLKPTLEPPAPIEMPEAKPESFQEEQRAPTESIQEKQRAPTSFLRQRRKDGKIYEFIDISVND
jgi:hypothetical protein